MKYPFLYILLGILLFQTPLQSQDQRTLQTKVADILNQIPARDPNQRNQLAEEMLKLGPDGLKQFAEMVVPDGTGDDTRVRTALNGLALYVGQPGREKERLMVSQLFLSTLERSKNTLVNAFFLYHLSFFGKSEIIPVVSTYLTHPDLSDDATLALTAIHEPAASEVFIQAFAKATDDMKPHLVKGVAAYGLPTSAPFLQEQAASANPSIRQQALRGLAHIGSPVYQKTLLAAAKKVGFGYEPTEATRSLIVYIETLAQNQHLDACKLLALHLIKATASTPQYTYALAALDILATQFGMDAYDQILSALDHPSKDYRAAALQSASRIQDIAGTRRLIQKATTATPETKAQILTFLGTQGATIAKDFIAQSLNATDPRVRAAALDATVALHQKKALPTLLEATRQIRSEAEKHQVQQLLIQLVGTTDAGHLTDALQYANTAGKALLIQVLAARHAHTAFEQILRFCLDSDTTLANTAYQALPTIAQGSNFNSLIDLLDKTRDATQIAAVQQALVAIAQAETGKQLETVWQQKPDLRAKLLGTFPQIGGSTLLGLTQQAYSDHTLNATAFQALTQWNHIEVASLLFDVAQRAAETQKTAALQAILRIIAGSSLPAEQKVQQLNKLITAASGAPALQNQVITQLGRIPSFPAFVAVAPFLDQPALQGTAAWAIMRIALPGSDGKTGLFGEEVRQTLEKCISLLSGPESDYAKENIRTWIRQMPKDAGFVRVFNGKDLSGWQGLVGNPISRATMTPEALAQAQREADAKLPQNWTVRDGEIRFTGTGFENLCSIKEYGDIEMWVDWRISKHGDSGIYLRGTPQVQIWDTSLVSVGAQVGSGGLYNNQKNPSKPSKVADNPVGEWNTFFIRMLGDKVTVYLNGELVADQVTLENYWDRKLPIFPSGPVELQAHGTDLAFKNVYIREIKSTNYQLTPEEETEGYVALFNGKDLSGWVGNKVDYKVVDQAIMIDPSAGGTGNLYTQKEYADFSFRFEFQLTPGANNGIGIRAPLEGDAAYVGMEIQVLDNTSPIYAALQPYQYHGSVYGVIPAKREFLKPVGQWNTEEIRIEGNRIRVTLNGTVIVDGDIYEASKNGTIDHNNHPGLKRKSGHIGFLGHGSEVRFRNLRIKTL